MAISKGFGLEVPYQSEVADERGFLSLRWQDFFKLLHLMVSPLGIERHSLLANNQTAPNFADIDGMQFNYLKANQAIIDYVIQRVTTGSGAVALIETGSLYLVYKAPNEWQLKQINADSPDDTGVNFSLKQELKFTHSYNHTTGLWTKSNHGLFDGNAVTLSATGALPTGYSLNTTYYVINSATNTFKLSATKGGAQVTANTNSGTGTQSLYVNGGQVQYTSTNITGTAMISKITWRARTLGAKVAG